MAEGKFIARLRYAPIAPRKLRYTVDQIRGKNVNQALSALRIIPKRGAYYINKLLNSAVANASNLDTDLDADNLFVAEARVDPGPLRKRWRSAPMGRAVPIKKRTSHIFIALTKLEEEAPKQVERKARTRKTEPAAKAEETKTPDKTPPDKKS